MSRNLAPPVREIAGSQNLVISGRCSDSLERELYIRVTKEFGWPWQERQIVQEVLAQITPPLCIAWIELEIVQQLAAQIQRS